jgi:hypothetical protein
VSSLRLRQHSRPVKSKCARKSYWGTGRHDTRQHQLEFFDWIGKQANQPGIRSVTRYKHPCWTRSKEKIITNMIRTEFRIPAVFFTWPKLQEKMWLPNPESYVRVVVRFVCVIHPGNRVRCYLSLPKLGSVSRMILSDVASIYVIIHHHHCRYDKLASYVCKPWQWVRQ